jgi:hypothetical protein
VFPVRYGRTYRVEFSLNKRREDIQSCDVGSSHMNDGRPTSVSGPQLVDPMSMGLLPDRSL